MSKLIGRLLVVLGVVTPICGNAAYIGTEEPLLGWKQVAGFGILGQTFTAEFSDLTSIGFYFQAINNTYPNDPLRMTLYEGSGFFGTKLKEVDFTLPFGGSYGEALWYDADFSEIELTLGSAYTMAASVTGTSPLWGIVYSLDYYSGGHEVEQGYEFSCGFYGWTKEECELAWSDDDLKFRVIGEAAIPTPANLPLLGIGLAALGYGRRKRKLNI
jgi:hypothetical protein